MARTPAPRRTDTEKQQILREYETAPEGSKKDVIKKWGVSPNSIGVWRQQFGSPRKVNGSSAGARAHATAAAAPEAQTVEITTFVNHTDLLQENKALKELLRLARSRGFLRDFL